MNTTIDNKYIRTPHLPHKRERGRWRERGREREPKGDRDTERRGHTASLWPWASPYTSNTGRPSPPYFADSPDKRGHQMSGECIRKTTPLHIPYFLLFHETKRTPQSTIIFPLRLHAITASTSMRGRIARQSTHTYTTHLDFSGIQGFLSKRGEIEGTLISQTLFPKTP